MKTNLTGPDLLNNSRLNKGTAFIESERDAFALHGLLPSHVGNLEDQRNRRQQGLASLTAPIEKYRFMRDLQDTNETLFYSLITQNVEETLPIVYTPTGRRGVSEIQRDLAQAARALPQLSEQRSYRANFLPCAL